MSSLLAAFSGIAAKGMDGIDRVVFVVAILAIPVSIWANVRWWRKVRRNELPREWQSFWMIMVGLVCMISIVCWYLFKFILPAR
ncbi:MAG: hypothetical protein BIFFINMI_03229 [Phycisphaerae bacterium]|nr:hypothetical protein [Phycisphaerae bacterium]